MQPAYDWMASISWQPQPFQRATWESYTNGKSGLVNAPTGSGKTYALLLPALLRQPEPSGLHIIWITPIRALAREIQQSAERAIKGMNLSWTVGVRTGDTSTSERTKMRKKPPNILITTPESSHLILAQKNHRQWLKGCHTIVVDEWHELLGSKRGVQMELALNRFKAYFPNLQVWGISATIGNLQQACEVVAGKEGVLIRADIKKRIDVRSVLPDEIEVLPWAGHLGTKLIPKVLPIIHESKTTLLFTNTRAQAEIWYQQLLEADSSLAGRMAMHHGSISRDIRHWVEEALYRGDISVVICTSSLDLGVDFRPVDTIIQVGSPKGVSRFVQRAGRSGHQPDALSVIHFVPTHSLELVEAVALREAVANEIREDRMPLRNGWDVLVQYLVTLAVSDGFYPEEVFAQLQQSHAYADITREMFEACLVFITRGGKTLGEYDEFKRVDIDADGKYVVNSRKTAMRHRMSIGTIVSDAMLRVKFAKGGHIGTIEEWFVARLKPGDSFWFAGRSLELIRIKNMEVQVKLSKSKNATIPSWMGGRMPLSAKMGAALREQMQRVHKGIRPDELGELNPLWNLQAERSHLPAGNELLIEYFRTREGFHLCCYPFEGRNIHEGLAAMLAHHLSMERGQTFSIAMNDYGFELLSDQEIPIHEALETLVFERMDVESDLEAGINAGEMARRTFRDIAAISGLVFQGYPGKPVKDRHLQASSGLLFDVLQEYEPEHFLLKQAYREVYDNYMESERMQQVVARLRTLDVVLTHPEKPTPFAFPIMVDRLRERVSNESLEDRVKRMQMY